MLQMILSDQNLFVDPEILAELSEDQRQTLFYKIREEQVHRWNEREKCKNDCPKKPTRKKKNNNFKKVEFLNGADGKDWVWLMGEAPADESWEARMEFYSKMCAEKEAEKVASEISKCEKNKLKSIVNEKEQRIRNDSALGSEQREKELAQLKRMEQTKLGVIVEDARRASLSMTVEIWQKKDKALQNVRLRKQEDSRWHDIVKRGMNEDKRRCSLQRQAREDARNSIMDMDPSDLDTLDRMLAQHKIAPAAPVVGKRGSITPVRPPRRRRQLKPKNREDVIDWFREIEMLRSAGQNSKTGKMEPWFHGILSQAEAERILNDREAGSFLVRVLLKAWGYVISYKINVKTCLHYMVDTSGGTYQLFGKTSPPHVTLSGLIKYHQSVPLSSETSTVLTAAVGQSFSEFTDYDEFFMDVFDTKL